MQPTTDATSDVTPTDVTGTVVTRTDAGRRRVVLIVDDHPLYRAGLIWALAPLPIRFAEAATLMAAVDALERESFDLILYDWHLPDGGGCKGLAAISQLAAQVPVIVISADEDEAIDVAARCMGAVDRMTKAEDCGRLRAMVSRVLQCAAGAAAATPAATRERSAAASCPPSVRCASTIELTQRQRDVLRQMASGQPNKRIAKALGIADSTVRAHVSEILRLMHARNRTEAVVRAQRESLLALGG